MSLALIFVGYYLWPKMKELFLKLGLAEVTLSQWLWTIGSGFGFWMALRIISKMIKKRR